MYIYIHVYIYIYIDTHTYICIYTHTLTLTHTHTHTQTHTHTHTPSGNLPARRLWMVVASSEAAKGYITLTADWAPAGGMSDCRTRRD